MSDQEFMVMEGKIVYPYKWAVGKAAARFLAELRYNKRIMALKCPGCGKVVCPPFDVCGECFSEPGDNDWVEVGPCGTVDTYTVVAKKTPWSPVEVPYALASIKIDGADTCLIHIIKNPGDDLRIGARVEAVFAEEEVKNFMALASFRVTDKPVDESRPAPVTEFEARPMYEVHGKLSIPYSWSYGETLSKFFQETRDNKKILGAKCTNCGGVLVPPVGICGKCFAPTSKEWFHVSDKGILLSWTVVYLPFPGQPQEPPYCYGMIRFDGVNTQFPHLIKGEKEGNWDDLEMGMRVEAVWNEDNRKGDLYDIRYFKKEGS